MQPCHVAPLAMDLRVVNAMEIAEREERQGGRSGEDQLATVTRLQFSSPPLSPRDSNSTSNAALSHSEHTGRWRLDWDLGADSARREAVVMNARAEH